MRYEELCSAADRLEQNIARFWSEKRDFAFHGLSDGFCFVTALGLQHHP